MQMPIPNAICQSQCQLSKERLKREGCVPQFVFVIATLLLQTYEVRTCQMQMECRTPTRIVVLWLLLYNTNVDPNSDGFLPMPMPMPMVFCPTGKWVVVFMCICDHNTLHHNTTDTDGDGDPDDDSIEGADENEDDDTDFDEDEDGDEGSIFGDDDDEEEEDDDDEQEDNQAANKKNRRKDSRFDIKCGDPGVCDCNDGR